MNDFSTVLNEALGDDDSLEDIRVCVRRCLFFDFDGYPLRFWQGQGKLYTSDANEWLGTIDGNNRNFIKMPPIQDGRDGTSATYNFGMNLIDIPGQTRFQAYEALKTEQWRVNGRKLIIYLVIFTADEGVRPATPISFFKELIMFGPRFSETINMDSAGRIVRNYSVSISCKDGNYGRSNVPGGTYADTIQKERAKENGVLTDKGCEYVASLANRTYQLP